MATPIVPLAQYFCASCNVGVICSSEQQSQVFCRACQSRNPLPATAQSIPTSNSQPPRASIHKFKKNTNEIDNVPHEILMLGYLRQISDRNDHCSHIITQYIIHLCYSYYCDQENIHKIDSFINGKINDVKEMLDTTDNQSLLLLLKNKWNVMFTVDKYFNNPSKTLKAAGCHIQHGTEQKHIATHTCQSCVEFDETILSIECQHEVMCQNCWVFYLKTSLNSADCLSLTCPKNGCNVIVQKHVWKTLLCKQYQLYYQRYLTYLRQNCINHNKEFTKCSNIHCNMVSFMRDENAEYVCSQCHWDFNCVQCKESPHFPISCEHAQMWRNKALSSKEHISAMELHNRKCPNCAKVHAKFQGNNAIRCECNTVFCWLCGQGWAGNHKCSNVQMIGRLEGQYEKYNFEYNYMRYYSHLKSSQTAMKQRNLLREKAEDCDMDIIEGIESTIRFWKILAWSYAITFYLNRYEIGQFVQYQHELEKVCEQLQRILDVCPQLNDYNSCNVKSKFLSYAGDGRNFTKQMLKYMQNELHHFLQTN